MENGVKRKQVPHLLVIMVLKSLLKVVLILLFTFRKNRVLLKGQKMKFQLILILREESIQIINLVITIKFKQQLIFKLNLLKFHHSINQIHQIKIQIQVKHKNLFNQHLLNFSLVAVETVKLMNINECILHLK
jgi:hypothetical protein